MASFSPHIAPESLESILSSLEILIDHRHQPHHDLSNAPYQTVCEPFSDQLAEQYDDPLYLEEAATNPVSVTVINNNIPVLRNIISSSHLKPKVDIEQTLNELRAELNEIVEDIMLDAREQLLHQDSDDQEIMKTSLKQFLHDLTARLPQ